LNIPIDDPMKIRVAFSSDLHGNLVQYRKLVSFCNENMVNVLCIGGDLFPKSKYSFLRHSKGMKTLQTQRDCFQKDILPILQEFKYHVYITFGNADFYANISYFEQLCQKDTNITVLNSCIARVVYSRNGNEADENELYLLGYAGVPFSRHYLKDFERFDTTDPRDTLEKRNKEYLSLIGYVSYVSDEQFQRELLQSASDVHVSLDNLKDKKSENNTKYGPGVYKVAFPTDNNAFIREFSIESQMKHILLSFEKSIEQPEKQEDVYRKMIWMCHGPPIDTCLDCAKSGEHVGSLALKSLIAEKQPLLTLHGHIHETVDKSQGKYREEIGKTISCSSGNYPSTSKVSIILCDIELITYTVEKTHRVLV
jgi:Icc-related predicted phosphoesterase